MIKKKYFVLKRCCDILLSIIMIIVFLPLFILISIAIKIESKGPIIFKQIRLGKNGKEFYIYKFRSMVINAEKDGVYERKNDIRVTKVGKIIRKTSVDELPQLINILKGEMSFIGPRPVLTYHPWRFDEYTEEQKKRFLVKPGVTGWAQIHGRKKAEWNQRIIYDVYYVENISFILDLEIFIKTIYKVILMKDNYNDKETVNKKENNKDNVEVDVHN